MATDVASSSSCDGGLLRLEEEVLSEKAKGLSDLEVALRLRVDERTVRSIFRRHRARHENGKGNGGPPLTRAIDPQYG